MKKSIMMNVLFIALCVMISNVAFAGNNKVMVCHKSKVIWVNEAAVDAHIAHGDSLGACVIEAIDLGDKELSSDLEQNERRVNNLSESLQMDGLELKDVGLQLIQAEEQAPVPTTTFNKIYVGAYNGYYNGDAVIEIALRTSENGFKSKVNGMKDGSKTVTITITDDITGEVINVTGTITTHKAVASKWTNMQTNK